MKVILFDIDGTLVRAGGAGRKALARAAEALYGRPGLTEGIDMAGRTDAWICRQVFRRARGRAPSVADFTELRDAYLRRLPGTVRKAVAEGRYVLPAGVKALVRRLAKERDVLLGLGTGNFERGARIKLGPGGLNRFFAFGGFGCDGLDRCRILKTAARRARRLAPGGKLEVFVVGDTPHDVSAGRKAGYTTVAVGTGFAPWKELAASKPDHLARDFKSMGRWLGWFGIASRR
ncbi:MAG: HAD hydrolase-like protein [Elusimicrobia bacterium]|nr:HAD hydrolase-like protein [Elusimicrobiota bacterium]